MFVALCPRAATERIQGSIRPEVPHTTCFRFQVLSHLRSAIPCLRDYYLTRKRSRAASTAVTTFTTCEDGAAGGATAGGAHMHVPRMRSSLDAADAAAERSSSSAGRGRGLVLNGETIEMEEYIRTNGSAAAAGAAGAQGRLLPSPRELHPSPRGKYVQLTAGGASDSNSLL